MTKSNTVKFWEATHKSLKERYEKERAEWTSQATGLRRQLEEVGRGRGEQRMRADRAEEKIRRLEQTIMHLGLAFSSIGGKGMV